MVKPFVEKKEKLDTLKTEYDEISGLVTQTGGSPLMMRRITEIMKKIEKASSTIDQIFQTIDFDRRLASIPDQLRPWTLDIDKAFQTIGNFNTQEFAAPFGPSTRLKPSNSMKKNLIHLDPIENQRGRHMKSIGSPEDRRNSIFNRQESKESPQPKKQTTDEDEVI